MNAVAPSHIVVVDDDPELRRLLGEYLCEAGYRVTPCADGAELQETLRGGRVDLVVLDLMLPGDDGLILCRRLRADSKLPVLMLTARGDEIDRVIGLESGADDYLAKPFSLRELLARIRSVLRRAGDATTTRANEVLFCGWTLDLGAHYLRDPAGVVVPLPTGEFRVLRALAEGLNRVLSRNQLLDAVAGREATPVDRTIDVLISRLRRRLRDDAREPHILRTVRSEGYMLVSEPGGRE